MQKHIFHLEQFTPIWAILRNREKIIAILAWQCFFKLPLFDVFQSSIKRNSHLLKKPRKMAFRSMECFIFCVCVSWATLLLCSPCTLACFCGLIVWLLVSVQSLIERIEWCKSERGRQKWAFDGILIVSLDAPCFLRVNMAQAARATLRSTTEQTQLALKERKKFFQFLSMKWKTFDFFTLKYRSIFKRIFLKTAFLERKSG